MSLHSSQVLEVYKYLLSENLGGRGRVASAVCEPYAKYVYTLPVMNLLSVRTDNIRNSNNIF